MERKSPGHIDNQALEREDLLLLIRVRLERSFSNSNKLQITKSKRDNSRIRAYFANQDEGSYYTGVIEIPNDDDSKVYVVEQHFPHHREKPTFFWAFDPSSNTLRITAEVNELVEPIEDADIADTNQFLHFMEEINGASELEDYEKSMSAEESYQFKLEDLQ